MDDGAPGLIGFGSGGDAQQRALATLKDGKSLGSECGQGALASDEALDGAVGEHDRLVTRLRRRGALGKHHPGMDERHPVGLELHSSFAQFPRCHAHDVPPLPEIRI